MKINISTKYTRLALFVLLAFVIYRQYQLPAFDLVIPVVWLLGTFALLYFWPRFAYYGAFRRALLTQGLGDGPIPINTLYAVPYLGSPTAPHRLLRTGANRDTLYIGGWLDLSKGPQVLHVPEMVDRYYSVQFTDSSDGADFAYVGTRTTGTQAGDYLISGPNWQGNLADSVKQIVSPNNSTLVIGRVLVKSDSDLATAYGLSKQIELTPLSQWHPGR